MNVSTTRTAMRAVPKQLHIAVKDLHVEAPKMLNCHRASLGKVGRAVYTQMYPTKLVQPDGSSFTVRYHEPRKIIKVNTKGTVGGHGFTKRFTF